jgi:DNA mismatch repair protein MutS
MFGQDAVTASSVLQITLTTRDKGKENAVPMCGVPYFTSETYISKLIKAGYKVALCEQIEDPKESRGIVKREVVKVYTPGTFLPDDPKEHNYIVGFTQKENIFGFAVADITTGEFFLYQSHSNIEDEINRFEPKEILFPQGLKNNPAIQSSLNGFYVTPYEDWYFDYIESYRKLLKHFKVTSLEGFGCEDMVVAISAAGALLNYLEETHKSTVSLKKLSVLRRESHMVIDANAQKNLEITRSMKDGGKEGSMLWVMDETFTPMGGRLLRTWLLNPLLDTEEINARLDAVNFLIENSDVFKKVHETLKDISDIERLTSRVDNETANAPDLLSLKKSLEKLPILKSALHECPVKKLSEIYNRIDLLEDVKTIIEHAISDEPSLSLKDGGIIKKGFNSEVDELRQIRGSGKDFIASLQVRERERTGIPSLKIGYNRIFGYYIEVTKTHLSLVPDDYVRKQTLVNGERFITPELKEYEAKVLGAEERLKQLEYELFVSVRKNISRETQRMQVTSTAVAEIDVLQSFAYVAKKYSYERPVVDTGDTIQIIEGRHPVIERISSGEKFIPNNTFIDNDTNNILIITGPNMAGKSTYMRQVALIILLAQSGSFIPAKDAKIGVVDRIFTRIGASDAIVKGQSTFMVEMIETASILNNATKKSLVLLDEIGRGTSTFDGISIAWAVVEFLVKKIRARTMFATHYHELTELALCYEGIKNLNVAVKEWGDEIIFLRRIEEGSADKSYGIQVARLAGLPEETIERAKEVLSNLEKSELNELGAPKLAYSPKIDSSKMMKRAQLDLFATQADPVLKEILGLDILNMTPIEALNKLFEMRRKLTDKEKKQR